MVNPDTEMEALNKKMSDLIQIEIPEEKIGIKTLALDKLLLYTIDGKNQRIQYVRRFIAIAGVVSILIAILTVSAQTLRVAYKNPIDILRYE